MENKYKLSIVLLIVIAFIFGCTNKNEQWNTDALEDTDDIETLVKTNEQLIQQIEEKKEEIETLEQTIEKLQTENMELKDDILTYKQQIYELEDRMEEERLLRNELDEKAMHLFEAMNEKNHQVIESIVGNNITVNRDLEQLEIDSEQTEQTFPYLTLETVRYVRQANYEFDWEEERFVTEYIMYTGGVKEPFREEIVYLTFEKDLDWQVVSISYIP